MGADEANEALRQHTVSKVVLKRFRDPRKGPSYRKLTVLDRGINSMRWRGPAADIFVVNDFIEHKRVDAELRWQAVERRLPIAYRAIQDGTALQRPEVVSLLKDVLATHWVRSPSTLDVHDRLGREVVASSMRELAAQPQLLDRLHQHRTGLISAGAETRELANQELHSRSPELFAKSWFESTGRYYEGARNYFVKLSLEIVHAPPGFGFIIGDVPAITAGTSGGFAPHQGVALMNAAAVSMPIDPGILIALGPDPVEATFTEDQVHAANSWQRESFIRWLACPPGGYVDTRSAEYLKTEKD